MYLRTARLDLDDYNNDTEDGLHITSMGGTWMAFVMAFGGMRIVKGKLTFNPFIPESWKSYAFKIDFGGAHLEVIKESSTFQIINHSEVDVPVTVWGTEYEIKGKTKQEFKK